MEHNNNELNYVEYTKIGSFIYALKGNKNLDFLEEVDISKFERFALIDDSLNNMEKFYIYIDDYVYNIIYNYLRGHKMIISLSNEEGLINVYSTNYNEVIEKNKEKVKKR